AVQQHVELQATDHADDRRRACGGRRTRVEQLRGAFARELTESGIELFAAQRISDFDAREMFWGEAWQSTEVERASFSDRVAHVQEATVDDAHDVAGESFLHRSSLARHHR